MKGRGNVMMRAVVESCDSCRERATSRIESQ